MAMKKSTGNSVRVKPVPYIKLPATPAPKPTMRSTAKDKPMTAKEKAKGNKAGLKAANKPAGYVSADAARSKSLERAKLVPPAKRTAAQKIAIRQGLADFNLSQKGKTKATTPNRLTGTKMKRVPARGGRGGGLGGLNINNLKK